MTANLLAGTCWPAGQGGLFAAAAVFGYFCVFQVPQVLRQMFGG